MNHIRSCFRLLIIALFCLTGSVIAKGCPRDSVYQTGDYFKYAAVYEFLEEEIKDTLEVTITGNPWNLSSLQMEAKYELINVGEMPDLKRDYGIDINWSVSELTGFIDNKSQVWNHPIRIGKYFVLELAAFPKCYKMHKLGDEWSNVLYIGKGWGRFRGKSKRKYEVVAPARFIISDQTLDVSQIKAVAKHRYR